MADEPPKDATDERPKIFSNMTAWIGGATALVVALGGLAGAYRNLFPDVSPPAQTAPAPQEVSQPTAASTSDEAQAPTSYTTDDGGSLKVVDGMWLWTTKDGDKYRYKELSNDGTTTVAVLTGGGENGKDVYLRWPNAGGQAFQSFDDQATWTDPVDVTPAP